MIHAITTLGWAAIIVSSLGLAGCLMALVLARAAGRADENLDKMTLDRRAKEAEFDLDPKDPPQFHK